MKPFDKLTEQEIYRLIEFVDAITNRSSLRLRPLFPAYYPDKYVEKAYQSAVQVMGDARPTLLSEWWSYFQHSQVAGFIITSGAGSISM